MDKQEELMKWKEHLREILPDISEQIDWIRQGEVKASVSPNCPEKLKEVAERLVELQNSVGEYQRSQISKQDVERIKYYAKTEDLSFEHVIQTAVENSRYLSKTAIEARGVVGFITEIQNVYNEYYEKYGVFPINAMNAEVKRACRNFKTDVSLKDKIEAIVDVFFPEMQGMNIVERDNRVIPQEKPELTSDEIIELRRYFNKMAKNGNIDSCFEEKNQEEFLEKCKILQKANISLSDFLRTYTPLSYTPCYSVKTVPAVSHMLKAHMRRYGTTRNITKIDPYLRHKIEVVQKLTGKYSMLNLINFLHVNGDNTGEGRIQLSESEIRTRRVGLIKRLGNYYPDKFIDENFIKDHPADYEELKFISGRCGFDNMDSFLNSEGFTREVSHTRKAENVIYLSAKDLGYYSFYTMSSTGFMDLELKELNPAEYIGVYNKLIAQGLDSSQFLDSSGSYYGE